MVVGFVEFFLWLVPVIFQHDEADNACAYQLWSPV